MNKITDMVWIGNSLDEANADLATVGITAILKVANDLQGTRGWYDGLLYAQCGLVDGPGSSLAAYHSAVLQLLSLIAGKRKTLVVDHDGGSRAMAVVIMALHARERGGWDKYCEMIANKMDVLGYEPHEAHRVVFNRLNWRILMQLAEVG